MTGLFRWGKAREAVAAAEMPVRPVASSGTVTTSKVLPRFLAALTPLPAPVLMDLGPVVGSNIAFFGEQLSCKFYVEDFLAALDTHRRGQAADAPAGSLPKLAHDPASIDGILCWDLFDYLDRATSQALAASLATLLRPGGVLYGFFGTTPIEGACRARFAVEGAGSLRVSEMPSTPTRRNVLVTRDITKMFTGLVIAESVLLKANTREILFRKA